MANLVQLLGKPDLKPAPKADLEPAPLAGSSLQQKVREAVAKAIRLSGKSRQRIAEEMTELIGTEVTVHMLNGYTANSKQQTRFPASFVPAFCLVTGDDRVQRILLSPYLCGLLQLGEHELAIRSDIAYLSGIGSNNSRGATANRLLRIEIGAQNTRPEHLPAPATHHGHQPTRSHHHQGAKS